MISGDRISETVRMYVLCMTFRGNLAKGLWNLACRMIVGTSPVSRFVTFVVVSDFSYFKT